MYWTSFAHNRGRAPTRPAFRLRLACPVKVSGGGVNNRYGTIASGIPIGEVRCIMALQILRRTSHSNVGPQRKLLSAVQQHPDRPSVSQCELLGPETLEFRIKVRNSFYLTKEQSKAVLHKFCCGHTKHLPPRTFHSHVCCSALHLLTSRSSDHLKPISRCEPSNNPTRTFGHNRELT
jgi:hypothetical protein